MGSFADYLEDELLDHVFGKGSYTPPTIYVALSTADPTDDASGLSEPSGGSYARLETAASDWNTSSSGTIDNANSLEFTTATGSWGTISHFALYDASSGGNMLAHGSVTTPKSISSGETARFAAGELDVSLG
jgi:hypothetical protein